MKAANRLMSFRRLFFVLTHTYCYVFSITLLQLVVFFFVCHCLMQGWQHQLRGHMRSAESSSSSEPGLTDTAGGKDVSETLWYNGQWPPPLSMTCYQSRKGPSVTYLTCYAKEPSRCGVCQLPTNRPPKAKTSAEATANWDGVQRYSESISASQPPLSVASVLSVPVT